MELEKTARVLQSRGEPAYRLKQIAKAVYRDGVRSYLEISTLPKALREALDEEAPIQSFEEAGVSSSKDGRAHKALLRAGDGELIETVLLKPKPGEAWSCCISCQAGCAIGCAFCATGSMGLNRSLTPEEISDQVLYWRQYMRARRLKGRLTNVVYMGMGEPFHCYDAVAESLRILLDPERFGLASRNIAVSTSGIAPAMERFASDFPQVSLALSLHAGSDDVRDELVPLNRAYPLEDLAKALKKVFEKSSRKVFLEYVLLDGVNDQPEHADQLAAFVKSIGRPELLHVNLIAYNQTGTEHKSPGIEVIKAFRERLKRKKVSVTVRKSLGADIRGACGQLAVQKKKRPGGGGSGRLF